MLCLSFDVSGLCKSGQALAPPRHDALAVARPHVICGENYQNLRLLVIEKAERLIALNLYLYHFLGPPVIN